ncbi:hypothetical protein GCM10023063_47750 [Arthrobacter methylotrophus]
MPGTTAELVIADGAAVSGAKGVLASFGAAATAGVLLPTGPAAGDSGAGAACGRPDPDAGADAGVVLSVLGVELELEGAAGAAIPASGTEAASGPEAGAITVRKQATITATGTAIRLNVSPDSRRAPFPNSTAVTAVYVVHYSPMRHTGTTGYTVHAVLLILC